MDITKSTKIIKYPQNKDLTNHNFFSIIVGNCLFFPMRVEMLDWLGDNTSKLIGNEMNFVLVLLKVQMKCFFYS